MSTTEVLPPPSPMPPGPARTVRRILFIAYHFHPDAAVGAVRTNQFAKFLPEYGWEPHVLTVDPRHYPRLEAAALGFKCRVTRTRVWPTVNQIYGRLRSGIAEMGGRIGRGDGVTGETPVTPERYPKWKRFINSLSNTPDVYVGWYIPAVRAAMRLVEREPFDAIYTSGPPHTTHLVGLAVAKRTGLPWAIDFRDPWYEPERPDPLRLEWSKDFDRRKESEALSQAALVLTTTHEWREELGRRHGPAVLEKCVTLTNGFDTTRFPPVECVPIPRPPGPTTLFHGGTLYAGRDPSELLRAVGEMIGDGSLDPERIRLAFFGAWAEGRAKVDRIVSEHDLGGVVQFSDAVGKEEHAKRLLASDILLLLQSDESQVHLPAKTFEYLATGNRILVLTGEGATKNFMKGWDHVWIAHHEDKAGIRSALSEMLATPYMGLSARDAARIREFSREKLATRFADLLTEYVAERA